MEFVTIKRSSGPTYVKQITLSPAPSCTIPTIAWATQPESGAVGDADFVASVTTAPGDAVVTWESSNTNVATVSNGTIHYVAAGSATITAKFTGDGETSEAER